MKRSTPHKQHKNWRSMPWTALTKGPQHHSVHYWLGFLINVNSYTISYKDPVNQNTYVLAMSGMSYLKLFREETQQLGSL